MGEFAKVIRWTAPGATVILTAGLVVALGRWLLWQDIWPAAAPHQRALVEVDSGVIAVLVAAAVPLGFLIYQLYFYLYSRSEGVFFEFVHQDVGAEVLKKVGRSNLTQTSDWVPTFREGLFLRWPRGKPVPWTSTRTRTLWLANSQDQRLLESSRSVRRPVLKSYRTQLERNWRALDTKLNTADVKDARACDRVFASLARLADIYHTLGATKLSLMFGWATGSIWLLASTESDPVSYNAGRAIALLTIAVVALGAAVGAVVFVLHENRRHCLKRRISALQDACRLEK